MILRPPTTGSSLTNGTIYRNDGTIGGDPILGMPAQSTDLGYSLGSGFQQVDAQPAIVELGIVTESDGTSNGRIDIRVDETGDGSADKGYIAFCDSGRGAGIEHDHLCLAVPAEGQIRIFSISDPANGNKISEQRKYVVSS